MVHSSDTVGDIGASDIAVSCPLCHEGKSWKRKHRLHLYIKPSWDEPAVHCWNCGYSSNLYGYLKEYHPSEYEHYTKAKRGKSFAELRQNYKKPKQEEFKTTDIETGLDIKSPGLPEDEEHEETAISKTEIDNIDTGFKIGTIEPIKIVKNKNNPILIDPVENLTKLPQEVKEYITNRGIIPQDTWLYSPLKNKIRFNNMNVLLSEYIIVPLILEEKWYGFQALAWKQKKFFVYLVSGNSSWKVENWGSIDKNKPVYITEAIYDRLSTGIKNSIAVLGANLHIDRLKELKEPIFCLDNNLIDEKSREETIKYLEAGYKCFIWPKGSEKFKDFNDLRKIGVSYKKIEQMINNNIYQGVTGIIKMKFIQT